MDLRHCARAALAAGLLGMSTLVNALQLGQLNVTSHLDEPLQAYVTMLVAAHEDPGTMRAQVLPEHAHAANGALTRTVADIRARVVATGDGGAYVALSSAAPIREPLLALRLRVEHARGANARSYDALIDPRPSVRTRPQRRAKPATEPVARTRGKAPVPRAESAAVKPEFAADGATRYGPVRAGENLWKIARKLRPDATVTIPAMIEALHAANPDAFTNGDVNRLKYGVVLSVPRLAAGAAPAVAVDSAPATPADAVLVEVPAAPATDSRAVAAAGAPPRAQLSPSVEAEPAAAIEPITVLEVPASEKVSAPAATVAVAPTAAPAEPETAVAAPAAPAASAPVPATEPEGIEIPKRAVDLSVALFAGLFAVLLLGLLARRLRVRRERRTVEIERAMEDRARLSALADKVAHRETVISSSNGKIVPLRRRPGSESRASDATMNPFAEIDLNLAYGRYDEAERVLKEIITGTPRNHQAKLKLAEAYFVAGRADDFAAVAHDLQSNHREFVTDAEWERLLDMGRSVAPSHRLFGGPVASGEPAG